MSQIFNPVDDLIAEQSLVDSLVADFTEDDWNRMGVVLPPRGRSKTSSAISRFSITARWSFWPDAAKA